MMYKNQVPTQAHIFQNYIRLLFFRLSILDDRNIASTLTCSILLKAKNIKHLLKLASYVNVVHTWVSRHRINLNCYIITKNKNAWVQIFSLTSQATPLMGTLWLHPSSGYHLQSSHMLLFNPDNTICTCSCLCKYTWLSLNLGLSLH